MININGTIAEIGNNNSGNSGRYDGISQRKAALVGTEIASKKHEPACFRVISLDSHSIGGYDIFIMPDGFGRGRLFDFRLYS